jgi:hypothetical protein
MLWIVIWCALLGAVVVCAVISLARPAASIETMLRIEAALFGILLASTTLAGAMLIAVR